MMKYYNIHTHSKVVEKDIISIYCLTEDEIVSGDIIDTPNLFYSCGIHPWHVDETKITVEALRHLINTHPKIIAIGEVGLDKLTTSSYDRQLELFAEQIKLSEDVQLPLIIHCVRAWDDLIRMYKEYKPKCPWILHGFRGGKQQAEQLSKLGFFFSLGEYFNKEALSVLYPDVVVLETDESSKNIKKIYDEIVRALEDDLAVLQDAIEQNVSFLFNFGRN